VTALQRQAAAEPVNAKVRIEVGNSYFDAERFEQAIVWYEAALKLDNATVDVSTDLATAYYHLNQVDRALIQLDLALAIDAKHRKALLNQGIIRAFGKNDLAGAAQSWQRLVAIAPTSEEGRRAKQGLDALKTP
jgi:tetratricopeptide (TPR) repeat protein